MTGSNAKSAGRTRRLFVALLLVATLVASFAKQLAVLLLRHALAALLDNGTHKDLTKFAGMLRGARQHGRPVYHPAGVPLSEGP